MKLNKDTLLSIVDNLYFESRESKTLIVSPLNGGYSLLENNHPFLSLLKSLKVNQPQKLSLLCKKPELFFKEIQHFFYRGIIALNHQVFATSSTKISDPLHKAITPVADPHTFPVLCIFHVHNYCNLACQYCYTIEEGITKEKLSVELMKKAVDEFYALPTQYTTFEFHGGEPSMAFSEIKEVVLYARKIYGDRKKVNFSIQTNAFALSKDMVDFFHEHCFSVRVSLDGTEETHNSFRHTHKKFGSYQRVKQGILALMSKGITPHLVTVVHQGNVKKMIEMHESMSALGAKSVRYLPMFKSPLADNSLWINGDTFFHHYFQLIQHIVQKFNEGKKLAGLPNLVAGEIGSLTSFTRNYMCMRNPCGAGINMVSLDINGDIYPCEEMIGKEQFIIGNLHQDTFKKVLSQNPLNLFLKERNVENIQECQKCTWKQFCHGGCIHKSYAHFKQLDRESEFCSYYKKIYNELIWLQEKHPHLREIF